MQFQMPKVLKDTINRKTLTFGALTLFGLSAVYNYVELGRAKNQIGEFERLLASNSGIPVVGEKITNQKFYEKVKPEIKYEITGGTEEQIRVARAGLAEAGFANASEYAKMFENKFPGMKIKVSNVKIYRTSLETLSDNVSALTNSK